MIVCHCAGVSDRDIAQMMEQGACTLGEITRRCGAGRHCPACRAELKEMLSATRPGESAVEAAA